MFPYTLIDLTHKLTSNIPTWSGACGFSHHVESDYESCAGVTQFRVMSFTMQAGIGTHIDAPSHCIPGGQSIHELDLNNLCMPCIIIDVCQKSHERYRVTCQDIAEFESMYEKIPSQACVMIKTGWEHRWSTPEAYRNDYVFPSVSVEAAEMLLQRGISALGIDTLSPDLPEDGFKVHQLVLGSGKLLIENVANLASMISIAGYVLVAPLNVEHGTEAPVRCIGFIPCAARSSSGHSKEAMC